MLKKIFFSALLALPVSLFAQTALPAQLAEPTQPEFGYFSYSEVFKAMPEYAEAQANLDSLKVKYDNELKRAEGEFNRKYAEFLQDQQDFPETILLRRQKELQQLMEQSIEFKNDVKRLLGEAQREMTAPVVEKLTDAVNTIGSKYALDYILNTDNNAYPYINGDRAIDITLELKRLLGIEDEVAE